MNILSISKMVICKDINNHKNIGFKTNNLIFKLILVLLRVILIH